MAGPSLALKNATISARPLISTSLPNALVPVSRMAHSVSVSPISSHSFRSTQRR
jgi:hypothetical protein